MNSLIISYSQHNKYLLYSRISTKLKLQNLIGRLSGNTVGFSCWKLFTINYFRCYEITFTTLFLRPTSAWTYMLNYDQVYFLFINYIQNRINLVLAVSGLTIVTTLLTMDKFRRTIRAIFGGSSTRSPKYNLIMTEIIESEERHIDCLEFIKKLYYEPLKREGVLTPDQLWDIFSNSNQVLEIHRKILQTLKSSKQGFEKTIFGIFSGQLGTQLEHEVAIFCSRHKLKGLNSWIQLKNDERIRQIVSPEAILEANPDSPLAKLTLEDHLSAIFQRPLRYPLLLERLTEECSPNSGEHRYLAKTLTRSREIGFNINEQVRRAERLQEINQKTVRAPGLPDLNLVNQKLVREDRITWRISKQKTVDSLLVLTENFALILRRESNGKFTYKYHKIPVQSENPKKTRHNPLVHLTDDLITKAVATDTNAFFLISTKQDVLYEFVAPTINERNLWMDGINKLVLNSKNYRNNKRKTFCPPPPEEKASDDVGEDQTRQAAAQEFKRKSGVRKSWFDSLSRRKAKGLSANARDKRITSAPKDDNKEVTKEVTS